jgi:hypothetical protein
MPIIGSFGAGSGKGFGFSGGAWAPAFIVQLVEQSQKVVIIEFIHLQLMEHLQLILLENQKDQHK